MQNCLLVVAHPGHELRVWGWLCEMRPTVCVLTDGSGSSGEPRIDLTTRILHEAQAPLAALYGAASDRAIYSALLEGNLDYFVELAQALYVQVLEKNIALVAGDAIEGYNPSHDLCRLLIDAVVAAAQHRGHRIANYEFPLMGDPRPAHPQQAADALQCVLPPRQWQHKLALIREYTAAAGGMLDAEAEQTLAHFGEAAFQQEWLFPAQDGDLLQRFGADKPFFERHGEQRVAQGVYRFVIRLREHLLPVERALAQWGRSTRI